MMHAVKRSELMILRIGDPECIAITSTLLGSAMSFPGCFNLCERSALDTDKTLIRLSQIGVATGRCHYACNLAYFASFNRGA